MSTTAAKNTLEGKEKLFHRSKERALECLNKQEFSRAFAHFMVALTIQPEVEDDFLNIFLYTLGMLSNEFELQQNWKELFMCYEQALDVLPNSSHILHGLAAVLFRLGHIESATMYFQKAYRENPFFTPSLYCIDNIKSSLVERWHFMMLNDKKRNFAFAKAIRKAVKEGCRSVLDIGAGTGILSMIAADAGAENVYACEGSEVMFQILKSVVEANKKNIHLLGKFSYDLAIPDDIPQKVDLVVTETFDAGLFGEQVLKTLRHAWEHLIKRAANEGNSGFENLSISENGGDMRSDRLSNEQIQSGRVIPHSAVLWAVPIECEFIRKYSRVCSKALDAFGLGHISASASLSSSDPYTTERLDKLQGGYKCLSSITKLLEVNFNKYREIESLLNGKIFSILCECTSAGKIDAVAVWFDLILDDEVTISTAPSSECCWEQAVFQVLPTHLQGTSEFVQTGESLEISFECKSHLTLSRVVTPSVPEVKTKAVSLNSEVISYMNLMDDNGISSANFFAKSLHPECPVLDITCAPLIGLKALLDGASKLFVLPSKHLMDMNSLMNFGDIGRERMRVVSYEDMCSQHLECGILITEPVELSGLLKKNIFEDIALLRSRNTKNKFMVLPQKIEIYAVLLESSDLQGQARVLSDQYCLGYRISEFLNVYKCNIHQDLQLSTVSHSQLCEPVKLGSIDLDKLSLEKNKLQSFVEFSGTVEVPVTKCGTVTAIPYWFSLDYGNDFTIDTSDPGTHWRQAAIITDTELAVSAGDNIKVQWMCRNSCLSISAAKC